jgi:exonuclease VII small subunit
MQRRKRQGKAKLGGNKQKINQLMEKNEKMNEPTIRKII